MEFGKPCKTRKEVKQAIINLEAKKTRLGEIWMDADGRPGGLQDEWTRAHGVGVVHSSRDLPNAFRGGG